jgi:hypothetical protein
MGVYGSLVSACADIASSGAGYRVEVMLSLVLVALGIRVMTGALGVLLGDLPPLW